MDKYRYALRRLSGPVDEPISLDAARRNCSIDTDEHDPALVDHIREVREYVEERTDVSLLPTQWLMTADGFPRGSKGIYLARWPAETIDEIAYTDPSGVDVTLSLTDVRLRIDEHGRGRIARKNWEVWPETAKTPDAVRIKFTAGWPTAIDVPATWQRAMLMLLTWWHEQRSAGEVGSISEVPLGVEALLQAAAVMDDFDEFEAA